MEKYYFLRFKSSPENIAYVLYQNKNRLEFLASSLSPQNMKISLDENGNLIIPGYFLRAKPVDKLTALKEASKKGREKIEKRVDKI